MTPTITEEMRLALREHSGGPIAVEDDASQQVYVLVARERFSELVDHELRRQLQVGFDQADRGESEPWDPEQVKAEGRQR